MNLTTGYPYSPLTYGLPYNYPKLDSDINAEVLIIGGGISGALSAYFLIENGIPCTLVDARTIGLGSSCASTSLLQYELDTSLSDLTSQIGFDKASRAYNLCSQSIDNIEDISRKINFTHFKRKKSLFYTATSSDQKKIQEEFTIRQKAGLEVQLLDQEEIKNQFGFPASGAILSEQGATTDAYLFTHFILQYCIARGMEVYDRTEVSKIIYKKDHAKLSTSNGQHITAKKIINATGYEITEMIHKKIVKLSSTYVIASEQMKDEEMKVFKEHILWNTATPYLYIRSTDDNRIVVGGRDETYTNAVKRDKLIQSKSRKLKDDFRKLFPHPELNTELSWAGIFGSTKDALPYIGTFEKTPHTYYALGFGGNGITFSAIAGGIISDLILGRKNEDAELFAFNR